MFTSQIFVDPLKSLKFLKFKNGPQNFALPLVLGAFPQPCPRGGFSNVHFHTKKIPHNFF